MHGGIVATILDELMVWAAAHRGIKVVTAELSVRFRSPFLVGEKIHGIGRITSTYRQMVKAEAWLSKSDGSLIAQATGKMFKS